MLKTLGRSPIYGEGARATGELNLGMVKIGGANAYLATAGKPSARGVLVLHPWWGLNDFIKEFSDRLARQGFTVLAPDYYGGRIASTIEEAERFVSMVKPEDANRELTASLEYLRTLTGQGGHGVGVVGFSMGASYAIWLAGERPEDVAATVLFYGTGEGQLDRARSKFLGHFAEKDPYEASDWVRKFEESLRSANKNVQFHTYPGTGHWFFENNRADAYNAEAAALAWDRTLKFLKDELR